jgi:hypothetical protein
VPDEKIAIDSTQLSDKSQLLCRLGLVVVAGLYMWTSVLTDYPGPNSDSLVYIYHSVWYTGGGEPWLSDFVRGSPFPPGYALWLSVFRASPDNVTMAIVANSIAYVISLAAFSMLARTYGITGLTNLALCGIAYLSFYFFSFTRSVGSEGLFMAFSFFALALLRTTDASTSTQKNAISAFLVASAYLVRSIGFLLIIAYLANEIRYRRLQLFPMIVLLIPVLGWIVVANFLFDEGRSYVAQFLGLNPVENLPTWVSTNVITLVGTLENFTGWHKLLAVALFSAVISNVLKWTLRLDPVGIYFSGYMVILILWPYPSHMDRFFLPLWPLAVLFLFEFVRSMRPLPKVGKRAVIGVLGVAMLVGSIVRFVDVGRWDFPEELERYRYTTPIMAQTDAGVALRLADQIHRGVSTAIEISRFVASEHCVASIVPHFVSFYSKRRVARIDIGAPHSENMRRVSVCPYVFVLGIESNSWEGSLLYPIDLPVERGNFTPLLMSKTNNGKMAAALFRYSPAATQLIKSDSDTSSKDAKLSR